MIDGAKLTRADLRKAFRGSRAGAERIGLEVEVAAVDPATGLGRAYEGPGGIRALLEGLLSTGGYKAIHEANHLVALERTSDGATVTLEPGGAIEYSSAPADDLCSLMTTARAFFHEFSAIASGHDTALLAAGSQPFNRLADANWMPKSRYGIMRDHFSALGPAGALATRMMTQTLSVQVSLDYFSEQDLVRKYPALTMAAPIATALFANSPLEEGRLVEAESRRGQIWLSTDPSRCGFVPPVLGDDPSVDAYIRWALEVPMIFRVEDGQYTAMHGRAFSEVWNEGFADGSMVNEADWEVHLSGIFTDVRLKRVLELRSMDGQSFEHIGAAPAFWVGICYDKRSLAAIRELLGDATLAQRRAALADICQRGLAAEHAGRPVLELARALVNIAKQGLERRVLADREAEQALSLLAPLEQVAETGVSFAQQVRQQWSGPLRRDPSAFVAKYRVP